MLTIHVVQGRLGYGIDYIKIGDEEGLVVYLLTRGVTDDNIMKALKGLSREGAYTIQQEESFVPPATLLALNRPAGGLLVIDVFEGVSVAPRTPK